MTIPPDFIDGIRDPIANAPTVSSSMRGEP